MGTLAIILLFVGISGVVMYAEHKMSNHKRKWGENY